MTAVVAEWQRWQALEAEVRRAAGEVMRASGDWRAAEGRYEAAGDAVELAEERVREAQSLLESARSGRKYTTPPTSLSVILAPPTSPGPRPIMAEKLMLVTSCALGELLVLAAWYYSVPRYSTVDLAKTQRKK